MKPLFFFLLLSITMSINAQNTAFSAEWQAILIAQNGAKSSFSTVDWQHFADTTKVLFLKQTNEKNASTPSDFTPILQFKNLRKLYLNNNQYFKKIEPALAKLILLEVLELENTRIKNLKFAKKLTELRRLDIRNTVVSSLEPLVGLPHLNIVLCIDTKVARQNIAKISARLPKDCRIIRDYTY